MPPTSNPPAPLASSLFAALPPAPIATRRPHAIAAPAGTRVDDYAWLRDDARKAPEVLAHLAQENAYTEAALAPLAGLEEALFEEIVARLPPEDRSAPVLEHGYWYYRRYAPGQEFPIYARRPGSMEAAEEILLDGNVLAQGLPYFELGDLSVSPDGKLLAYTVDCVGRRQYELRVRDLHSGQEHADRITDVEAETVWSADGGAIVYIRKDPVTLLSVRVFVHRLGTEPGADRLLYEEADDSYYLSIHKSRSESLVFLCCASTEQSEWHYARADDPELRLRCVLARAPGHEYEVEHHGDSFVLRTNRDAPNFRIVAAPIARCAAPEAWRDVVAHRSDTFIESFQVGQERLAINERHGGALRLRLHAWADGPDPARDTLLEAQADAGVLELVHTPGIDSGSVRYLYSSLVAPRTTIDFDIRSGARTVMHAERIGGGFDARNYRSLRTHAPARDGSAIPVTLAHRADTPLDGSAPLYLTGYGAYGLSFDPVFHASWVSLLDRGFVVAIAHIRGGQELGRHWYDAGRLAHKMNTFTDFIDATDALVRARYAAADRVCAQGGSAGGLLMGAIANMAPERYRAIVAHVPFVDVVTTMLDTSIPLTTNEFDQWGDPSEPQAYARMLAYSPYDNVRAQAYPAMLVFTGLWDSQVQYFEPAKWVAKLRALKTDANPLLFSIDMHAGHGGKSGRFARYHETAREFAFLLHVLGLAPAQRPAGRSSAH